MEPIASPPSSYLNIILFLIALGCLVGFLWALVELLRSEFRGNDKLIWLLVVLFAPFGWLFYFLIGRKKRIL